MQRATLNRIQSLPHIVCNNSMLLDGVAVYRHRVGQMPRGTATRRARSPCEGVWVYVARAGCSALMTEQNSPNDAAWGMARKMHINQRAFAAIHVPSIRENTYPATRPDIDAIKAAVDTLRERWNRPFAVDWRVSTNIPDASRFPCDWELAAVPPPSWVFGTGQPPMFDD